jgi:hypothetical protein
MPPIQLAVLLFESICDLQRTVSAVVQNEFSPNCKSQLTKFFYNGIYQVTKRNPRIESRWRARFVHLSRPALGPTQPPIEWVPVLSPWLKRPARGFNHPPSSSAKVKERVGLYLYSPSGLSLTLPRWTLFYLYFCQVEPLANWRKS